MQTPRSTAHRLALLVAALAAPGCWPAAPIAALSAGRGGGSTEDPTVALRGHVITDATAGAAVPPVRPPYTVNPADPPTLSLSADAVDFGATGTDLVVQARNAGGGTLTVTSIVPTATIGVDPTWLTTTLGADGKTITLAADRALLAPGAYEVRIDVASSGGAGSCLVDVTVGGSTPTPIGAVLIDLLGSDGMTRLARITATAADGYAWSLPRLPRGHYFLVAGVDLDSDGVIGEAGEPFGTYPNVQSPEALEVDALGDLAVDVLVQ